MKITDLRIGSQIFWDIPEKENTIHTVIGIRNDKLQTIPISLGDSVDEYKPIPISEEIFKQLGFTQLNRSYWERNKVGFIIGYAVDGTMVAGNSFGARHCYCYYVHQIQNIWYDVTGEWLSLA
jgi:hypothetical protein